MNRRGPWWGLLCALALCPCTPALAGETTPPALSASVAAISPSAPAPDWPAAKQHPATPFSSFVKTVFAAEPPPLSLSVIAVGDMMLGSDYPEEEKDDPPEDGWAILKHVAPHLRNADVTFGNLEGVLMNGGEPVKECANPEACYLFRSPTRYARHFAKAGFDLLSLANNHTGDFGAPGRKTTQKALDAVGIAHAGLLSVPTTVIERRGVRIGMAAFSPNTGTPDINDITASVAIVKALTKRADVVIVSFHGGAEGDNHQHVSRSVEIFYEEERGNTYSFSHAVIDAGADLVFGHGPHVTRAVELYKGRLIAYSLGNFATYARFKMTPPRAAGPMLKVWVRRDGRFVRGEVIPILQTKTHGPKVDPKRRVMTYLRTLSAADFPESPLVIHPDGRLERGRPAVAESTPWQPDCPQAVPGYVSCPRQTPSNPLQPSP